MIWGYLGLRGTTILGNLYMMCLLFLLGLSHFARTNAAKANWPAFSGLESLGLYKWIDETATPRYQWIDEADETASDNGVVYYCFNMF